MAGLSEILRTLLCATNCSNVAFTEVAMNAVGVLVSLVFIAIGLSLLYYARSVSAKAQQSLSWPQADGVIAHSAVLQQMQTSSSTNAATYKADVTYRYKVQGRDYSSE